MRLVSREIRVEIRLGALAGYLGTWGSVLTCDDGRRSSKFRLRDEIRVEMRLGVVVWCR